MKGEGLALIFGGPKKAGKKGSEPPEESESDEAYDIPPDFEDEVIKAFPELEGRPKRVMALWKAVKACMEM